MKKSWNTQGEICWRTGCPCCFSWSVSLTCRLFSGAKTTQKEELRMQEWEFDIHVRLKESYYSDLWLRIEILFRVRFHRCRSWIGRSGHSLTAVWNRRLDCAVGGGWWRWNTLVRCSWIGQIPSTQRDGLAVPNRATTGTMSRFEGQQVCIIISTPWFNGIALYNYLKKQEKQKKNSWELWLTSLAMHAEQMECIVLNYAFTFLPAAKFLWGDTWSQLV